MKRIFACLLFILIFSTETVFAQTSGGGVFLKRHTFEVESYPSYRIYVEPGVMREEGFMMNLGGSYAYHNRIMAKAEGIIAGGWVDYSNSGNIDHIPDVMLEFRGLAGYDFFFFRRSLLVTPFIGLGYRYLNDNMSGKISTTNFSGYDRESNYLYSPIGAAFTIYLKNNWLLDGTGEYDYFWWGKQISHLSNVSSANGDLDNRQKKGYGLRGTLLLAKKIDRFVIEFGPFVRYWKINQSEEAEVTLNGRVAVGIEPKNESTEFGIKVGLKF